MTYREKLGASVRGLRERAESGGLWPNIWKGRKNLLRGRSPARFLQYNNIMSTGYAAVLGAWHCGP